MKYTLTLLGLVLGSSACWPVEPVVTVCLPENANMDFRMVLQAEADASQILAAAGVFLRWKHLCKKTNNDLNRPDFTLIEIGWQDHAPRDISKNAYASARPFQTSGVRIDLYEDRIASIREPLISAILGHVLAHEIGHILLHHNGHSSSGLMRAVWSASDQAGMARKSMQFDSHDAECIRRNLQRGALMLTARR